MKTTNAIKRTHQLVAELQGCEFDLRAKRHLKAVVKGLLARHSVKVLKAAAPEFPNDGMTLFYILAESHLALHAWPEKGLVNVDLACAIIRATTTPRPEPSYAVWWNCSSRPKSTNTASLA